MESEVLGQNQGEWFKKRAFSLLLVFSLLISIFFIPLNFITPQFGSSILFIFTTAIVFILYFIWWTKNNSIYFLKQKKLTILAFVIVPLTYFLSAFAHGLSRLQFFGYTFDINSSGFILFGFLFMFLVSQIFNNKIQIFYSIFLIIASSIILSIFILLRFIFGTGFLSFGIFNDITSNIIGSWNNLGIFYGIILILSTQLLKLSDINKIVKIIFSLSIVISLLILTFVNFNLIWIILATYFLFDLIYSIYSERKFSKISLLLLCLSIVFVIWGGTIGNYLSPKLKITNVEIRPSFAISYEILKNTLQSNFWLGSGPNTFNLEWLKYKPENIGQTAFWNTNFSDGSSLILSYIITTGTLGLLGWIFFFGFFIYLGIKYAFLNIEDNFTRYIRIQAFLISLYLWIVSIFYVPSAIILMLAFFFTGLFFSSILIGNEDLKIIKNKKGKYIIYPIFSLILIILLYTLYISGQNVRSLYYFKKSSDALNIDKNVEASEDYIEKAISIFPEDTYYRALAEIELQKITNVVNENRNKISKADFEKQFNDALTKAMQAGISAKNIDKQNYLNWLSLGRVYELVSVPQLNVAGAYESAKLAYTEALKINPKNAGILLLFSRVAINHGNLEEAKTYAEQSISLKDNYLDAYMLLSQIDLGLGDAQGALAAAKKANEISPNNQNVLYQLGVLEFNVLDFKNAIDTFVKLLSINSQYDNAKYYLGISYEAIGEHQKALDLFLNLEKNNPNNSQVETILEKLIAGKSIFTSPTKNKK